MQPLSPEPFNDPSLKAALVRAWKPETAPAGLRERVMGLKGGETGRWWGNPLSSLAAAAVLILVLGGGFYYYQGREARRLAQGMPPTMAVSISQLHDRCYGGGDHHHVEAAVNDFTGISQRLGERLGRPVMAGSLQGGWAFFGASLCPINSTPSAHLLYRRGTQSLSIFSIPVDSARAASTEGRQFQVTTDDGHHIAGFVRGMTMYCLVGYCPQGSLDLAEVLAMRNEVRYSMPCH